MASNLAQPEPNELSQGYVKSLHHSYGFIHMQKSKLSSDFVDVFFSLMADVKGKPTVGSFVSFKLSRNDYGSTYVASKVEVLDKPPASVVPEQIRQMIEKISTIDDGVLAEEICRLLSQEVPVSPKPYAIPEKMEHPSHSKLYTAIQEEDLRLNLRINRLTSFISLLRTEPPLVKFLVTLFKAYHAFIQRQNIKTYKSTTAATLRIRKYSLVLVSAYSLQFSTLAASHLDGEELPLMLSSIVQAIMHVHCGLLDFSRAELFPSDFVIPDKQFDELELDIFKYIIGWVTFKIERFCKTPASREKMLVTIRAFIEAKVRMADSIRAYRKSYYVVHEPVLKFSIKMESLVVHLLRQYEHIGQFIFSWVKKSVLINNAIAESWTALCDLVHSPLNAAERSLLLDCFLSTYLKSKQKSWRHWKALAPKPSSTLRASLKVSEGSKPVGKSKKPTQSRELTEARPAKKPKVVDSNSDLQLPQEPLDIILLSEDEIDDDDFDSDPDCETGESDEENEEHKNEEHKNDELEELEEPFDNDETLEKELTFSLNL